MVAAYPARANPGSARRQTAPLRRYLGFAVVLGGGILLGGALLLVIAQLMPHEHFVKGLEGRDAKAMKRVWLFVLAIALHHLPEGQLSK